MAQVRANETSHRMKNSFSLDREIQTERRVGREAIPIDFFYYLRDAQYLGLIELEKEGWSLFTIRRIGLKNPSIIVRHTEINAFCELTEDGTLSASPVQMRENTHIT